VAERLRAGGLRVELDSRNERLEAKIRDAQLQKIPYMLVAGGREAEAGTVAVRHRSRGDLGARPLDELLEDLLEEVRTHG
jgi:threonyl-tRNA synthetase